MLKLIVILSEAKSERSEDFAKSKNLMLYQRSFDYVHFSFVGMNSVQDDKLN